MYIIRNGYSIGATALQCRPAPSHKKGRLLMTTLHPSTLDAARNAAAGRPAWARAIERAAVMLPASMVETLPAGRYRLVSAHSGAAYVTTRESCTCPAGLSGRPCWHRAAIALVEKEATRPAALPTCPECGAATVEMLTPGGERAYECSNPRCGRTLHADTYDRNR